MTTFGYELIIDLHGCDPKQFTRKKLKSYFRQLCRKIGMERGPLYFWDYFGENIEARAEAPDHMAGISAVQFIYTSNITVHALDKLNAVYVNIFSCKDFDRREAENFTEEFFSASTYVSHFMERP